MLSVYIGAGVIGVAMILFGAVSGLFDSHFDLGHDTPDHPGEVDLGLIPFLSLKFWTYFFAGFGLLGIVLTVFKLVPATQVILFSAGMGIVLGMSVHILMRYARKNQSGFVPSVGDIQGASGKVLVVIRPSEEGKVRLNIGGEQIDFIALSETGDEIPVGSKIVVTGRNNTTVRVANVSKYIQEELQ
jgi:membrane protein implicated in regulation of membrane protease activity